jgi:hypothetical protein
MECQYFNDLAGRRFNARNFVMSVMAEGAIVVVGTYDRIVSDGAIQRPPSRPNRGIKQEAQ